MIRIPFLFLLLFFPKPSFGADEDQEILRDLDFFRSLHLVKQVDEPSRDSGESLHPKLPHSNKNEVNHEAR
jgi:hypothetical protein